MAEGNLVTVSQTLAEVDAQSSGVQVVVSQVLAEVDVAQRPQLHLLSLKPTQDRSEFVTRVYPRASGISLAVTTRVASGDYALDAAAGYIVNTAAEALYGRRERVVTITLDMPTGSDTDDESKVLAANALYDKALEWLGQHDSIPTNYTAKVTGQTTLIESLTTIHLLTTTTVNGDSVHSLDADFNIVKARNYLNDASKLEAELELSTLEREAVNDAQVMAEAVVNASKPSGNSSVTSASTVVSRVEGTADINAGTIDGTVIGQEVPANATFEDVLVEGDITLVGLLNGFDVSMLDPILEVAGKAFVTDGYGGGSYADVLTPAEHTAIGDGAPHHAAVTLGDYASRILTLTGQALTTPTAVANTAYMGPATGADAAPTWRAPVFADIPSSANPGATAAILASAPTTGLLTLTSLMVNTNGDNALISTFKGANSIGQNVWIGGGGQSSIGDIADTTKGACNTTLGYLAGNANTTGKYNVFVGDQAGYVNTEGSYNTFIGLFAGALNTTGIQNMFLGYGAARANVDGNYNVAIGFQTLHAETSADKNVAIGWNAGYTTTSGENNTFLGYEAGFGNTTGHHNMFLGESAGHANTTGYYNAAIGSWAAYDNTVGNLNVSIGYQAGLVNTASNTTYIGSYAGKASTGAWNTAVGTNGLLATTSGYLLAALGFNAGAKNTTGYFNTFVGAEAGSNASQKVDAINSMALGANTYTNASNQVVIGDASVNVGLAQVFATARLHLPAGSATANTAPLKFTSGTVLTNPEAGAVEFLTDDYFVTITTGAARKGIVLDDGARLTSGKIPIASTNGRLVDALGYSSNPGAAASILATDASGYTQVVRLGAGVAPTAPFDASGSSQTSPAVNARVVGNALEFGHPHAAGYACTIGSTIPNAIPFLGFNVEASPTGNANYFRTRGQAGFVIKSDLAGGLLFGRVTNANADSQTSTDDVQIDGSGNVAIGRITPRSRLDVSGTTGITWAAGGNSCGLVTIGAGSSGASVWINTPSDPANPTYHSGLGIYGNVGGVGNTLSTVYLTAYGVNYGGYSSALVFSNTSGVNIVERLRIDTTGRIGVGGIASPTAALHLPAGSATASTAPLKFTSGTVLTTAEAGAVEFLTDDYFVTITTGAARKGIVLDDGARLTSGKIPIASTNGRLVDGQTPLAGTKVYYVSNSSGGAVDRKLTFINGILTAET